MNGRFRNLQRRLAEGNKTDKLTIYLAFCLGLGSLALVLAAASQVTENQRPKTNHQNAKVRMRNRQ